MNSIQYIKTPLAQVLERELDVCWTPSFKTPGSFGIDLRACIELPITLDFQQTTLIPTGLHLFAGSSSPTLGMFLLPRSSNPGWMLLNTVGLIDNDYQGELMLKVFNNGSSSLGQRVTFAPGERLAQAVFLNFLQPSFELVTEFSSTTERGQGGFGSTGNG